MRVIFCRRGHRYTAYLNAILGLKNVDRVEVPDIMSLGWKNAYIFALPGGVTAAVKLPRKLGSKSGAYKEIIKAIIGQGRRDVKCFAERAIR